MKKNIFILLAMLLFVPSIMKAQSQQDSVRLCEYLQIKHSDAFKWITRYQADIDKYTDENRELKDKTCDVLFLGSSSINLWDNIYNDMAPMKIIRRSYGGAAIRDMLYNYNVIARGYNPRSIVLYVENDMCNSPEDITIGQTFDFFRVFISRIQRDYPGIPLYVLSIKPSYAREKLRPKQTTLNTLLQEYVGTTKNVFYVDVASCMYDDKGILRKDIFKKDNLHMNQVGYDLWTARLKPLLMQHKK
ncbi:lipase [Bacteroides sedimenti]|uniref:Lipase n=1 Tax=Bacteroides sedimenti TaxID=2136147 RepID=A0ABN6Z4X1_9BACE